MLTFGYPPGEDVKQSDKCFECKNPHQFVLQIIGGRCNALGIPVCVNHLGCIRGRLLTFKRRDWVGFRWYDYKNGILDKIKTEVC